jgi:F-type H+-transporting ATPase subunit epsilon
VTIHVALVAPEGEVWSGDVRMVVASTLDGDVGILADHTPLLGILTEGSLVRIFPDDSNQETDVAIGGGFVSFADNRLSVLARQAVLGSEVDRSGAQSALDTAVSEAGGEDNSEIRFLRAQLKAAGDRA